VKIGSYANANSEVLQQIQQIQQMLVRLDVFILTALMKLILIPGVLSRVVILAVSLLLAALNSCWPRSAPLTVAEAAEAAAVVGAGEAAVVAVVLVLALVTGG